MMNEEQDSSASCEKRILVVDDNDDIRHIVEILLQSEGYLVEHANCGHECLLKVEHCQPDLILLDIVMPNMDGLQLAYFLRSNSSTASIPIIITSVLKSQGHIEDALVNLGIKNLVEKPIDPDELLAKVREIIG